MNQQLIDMTHELTEMLRRNRTIDWQLKDQARRFIRRRVISHKRRQFFQLACLTSDLSIMQHQHGGREDKDGTGENKQYEPYLTGKYQS